MVKTLRTVLLCAWVLWWMPEYPRGQWLLKDYFDSLAACRKISLASQGLGCHPVGINPNDPVRTTPLGPNEPWRP